MNRKQLSTRARFEIFKRDQFTCQYCGSTPPAVVLHVDHIHPVSKGGKNDKSNLVTSCSSCNLGKSDVPLTVVDGSLQEKATLIKEREAQIKGYYKAIAAQKKRIESESWEVARMLCLDDELESYNKIRMLSIRRFLDQISFHHVMHAAEVTANKFRGSQSESSFKYFCGCCWKMIREGNENA